MRIESFSRIDTRIVPDMMSAVVYVGEGDDGGADAGEIASVLLGDRDSLDILMITSYGSDPLDMPGLYKLVSGIKPSGLRCGIVTRGERTDALDDLLGSGTVDMVDLELSGVPSPGQQATMDMMRRYGYGFMVTLTLVPGHVDERMLRDISGMIDGSERTLLRNFDPAKNRDPELAGTEPFKKKEFEALAASMRKLARGVRVL